LREIIGDELTRIDDERLEFVTVTSVDVDAEMNRAIVYYDSLAGVEGDEQIQEVLGEYRARMQASINRQMHARKTPILSFKPDEVIRAAERIEQVLRENKERLARLDDGEYSPHEDDQELIIRPQNTWHVDVHPLFMDLLLLTSPQE